MSEEYIYRDKDGKEVARAIEGNADVCPKCGSTEIKCKGSFHKCLKCFERFETAAWVLPPQKDVNQPGLTEQQAKFVKKLSRQTSIISDGPMWEGMGLLFEQRFYFVLDPDDKDMEGQLRRVGLEMLEEVKVLFKKLIENVK